MQRPGRKNGHHTAFMQLPIDFSQKKVVILRASLNYSHYLALTQVKALSEKILRLHIEKASFSLTQSIPEGTLHCSLILSVDKERLLDIAEECQDKRIAKLNRKAEETELIEDDDKRYSRFEQLDVKKDRLKHELCGPNVLKAKSMSVKLIGHLISEVGEVKDIQKEEYEDENKWNKDWARLTNFKGQHLPIDFSQKKVILLLTNTSDENYLTLQKVEELSKHALRLHVAIVSFSTGDMSSAENICHSLVLTADKGDEVTIEPAGSNSKIQKFHDKYRIYQDTQNENALKEILHDEKEERLGQEVDALKAKLISKYCGPKLHSE